MIATARTIFGEQLLTGSAFALAGSATALWLPPTLGWLVACLVVLRICWIEDNIHHDLLRADRVPPGYAACRARRRAALMRIAPDPLDDTACPRMLASQLRIQSHAWTAYGWALAAAALLLTGTCAAAFAGVAAFALALRGVDRFALAQSVVLAGRPLAARQIAQRGLLTSLAVNNRPRD